MGQPGRPVKTKARLGAIQGAGSKLMPWGGGLWFHGREDGPKGLVLAHSLTGLKNPSLMPFGKAAPVWRGFFQRRPGGPVLGPCWLLLCRIFPRGTQLSRNFGGDFLGGALFLAPGGFGLGRKEDDSLLYIGI